jgi:hypothetical protein
MKRIALLLAFLLTSSYAHAQAPFPSPFDTRGTPEDQRACNKDAVKLCRKFMNDDMAVLRCFQSQREKLSKPCRAVLAKYGV